MSKYITRTSNMADAFVAAATKNIRAKGKNGTPVEEQFSVHWVARRMLVSRSNLGMVHEPSVHSNLSHKTRRELRQRGEVF